MLTVIDLVFRWLFIERKDALKLGFDPSTAQTLDDPEHSQTTEPTERTALLDEQDTTSAAHTEDTSKTLSLPQVIFRLAKSPRALAALLITVADGYALDHCF
jgi:hypothetical protein